MRSKFLGIDPGRSKTGLALVDDAGAILSLHVAQTARLKEELVAFAGSESLGRVIIGDGTNSRDVSAVVKEVFPDLKLETVVETHSTEEARCLYWQEKPPRGWRRFVPQGLLVPPEPLDAYAAVVLVRRWLKRNRV